MKPIFDIQSILSYSNASHIEWYLLPTPMAEGATVIDLGTRRPMFPSITFRNPQVIEEYRYKELSYIYDRSNDAQRTVFREALQEDGSPDKMVYRLILREDTLPSHRFPCSLEVHKKDSILRKSYKINNRLHLIEDFVNESSYHYYIRFNYAPNVDMVKLQQDLEGFVGRL